MKSVHPLTVKTEERQHDPSNKLAAKHKRPKINNKRITPPTQARNQPRENQTLPALQLHTLNTHARAQT